MRRFSLVAVRLIRHRPVPGRFVKRVLEVPGACQILLESYDINFRAPLKSYNMNFKQKSSGARPM